MKRAGSLGECVLIRDQWSATKFAGLSVIEQE